VTASLLEQLADLPKAEADALIRAMAPGEANALEYDWRYRARPEQLPPAGSWRGVALARPVAAPNGCARRSRRGVVGSPWWGQLRPTRAMLWLRAHPAFWPFRLIRSARFTSPASAG